MENSDAGSQEGSVNTPRPVVVSKLTNSFSPSNFFKSPKIKMFLYGVGAVALLILFFNAGRSYPVILNFTSSGNSRFFSEFLQALLVFFGAIGIGFLMLLHYSKTPFFAEKIKKIRDRLYPVFEPHAKKVQEKAYIWSEDFKTAHPKKRLFMLKVPAFLLVVYFLLSFFGNKLLPPEVVVTYPGDGGRSIPLDTAIEFQFDRPVNKSSFEKAFTITPNIPGKFEWYGDSAVTFIPDSKLTLASSYTVKVGFGVLSSFYVPKLKSDNIEFETLGNPTVVLASPQTESPEGNTPITVMFDRPMVPLTTTNEKEKLAPAFTINPPIEGEGRWLGTSAYEFRPTKPLKNATTYTYTIAKGLKSSDGGELKEDYSYSFSTQRPRVLSTSPLDNYQYASPTASVSATLSLNINPESARKSIHLYEVSGDEQKEVETSVRVSGGQVGMYPVKPLNREARYKAVIDRGLLSLDGENGTDSDYSWNLRTAPRPKALSSSPMNGAKDVDETYSVLVSFASPMDQKSFQGNVEISPAPERKPSYYFSSYQDNNQLSIGTYLKRSSNYTITIKSAVKDQYGAPLGSDYTFSFQTAPYKPSISISPSGTYFASFNQNEIPRIVSKVVNASEVTYTLYKLKKEDFLDLYKRVYIDYGVDRNLQNYDPSKLEKVRQWKEIFEVSENELVNVITKVQTEGEGKFASGLYFLDVRIPTGAHDTLVMVLTRTALTLKTSPHQAFIWAVDQVSGEVQSGANIELTKINSTKIGGGSTNSDGVLRIDSELRSERENYSNYQDPTFAFVQNGDDFGVVVDSWGKGINPYEFGLQSHYDYQQYADSQNAPNLKMYLVLDRPIYRPGQTVYFKGVVRDDKDGQYKLTGVGQNVSLEVTDSENKVVSNQTAILNSYGSFSGSFVLSSEGSVGYYYIRASVSGNNFSQTFQVEEYKKPDFSVEVTSEKADYVDGDRVTVNVDSRYYFGSPVDFAPVTWTLTTFDSEYRWFKDASFEFGDSDDYWYRPWWYYSDNYYYSGSKVTEGEGETNGDGHFDVRIPVDISKKGVNQRMRLEAVVGDTKANQVIANTREFEVYQAAVQVGIKPQRYSGESGEESKVDVVTLGTSGQELGNTSVFLSFYKRTWDYIKEEDPDTGEFFWTNKPTDTLVSESTVVTNEYGRAEGVFTPVAGGTFRVVAKVVDSAGRISKSATYVWISGGELKMPQENHDRIVMVTDKNEYDIGSEIKIVSLLPYEETTGLITIERGSVFDYKVIKTTSADQSATLSVRDNYSPNAYVSGIFIKKGNGIKDPAQMKMGLVEIKVRNPSKQLIVELEPDKKRYSPGEKMKVDIVTKDANGKAVQSEVAIALVDEAVWSLARIDLADIYQTFYQPRNLLVLTHNNITISMDRINANVNLGSKGGSGGGGGEGGPETLREKFLDTAYWNAGIETDTNGKASITIELPDNLTTWRLIGIGESKDTVVGDSIRDVLVTKDVLIQPILPRFLSVGDKPKLGIVVHNNTGSPSQVNATFDSEGLKLDDENAKSINIPAGSSSKIYWSGEVLDRTSTDVTLRVNSESGLSDAVKINLPIVSYFTPEVVATSGQAKDVGQEKVLLPEDVVSNMGSLSVSLSPSLGAGVEDAASFLFGYPYYCNEQIANKLIPAVTLFDLAKESKLESVGGYTKSYLETIIADAIQRLTASQGPDGGWGWWVNTQSDPIVSAMVLDGLNYSSEVGFKVDESVLSRAAVFINNDLKFGDGKDLEKSVYLTSVLARIQKIDAGQLSRLMDRRWQMSPIARGYLLRSLQEGGGSRQDQSRLLDEMLSLARKSNTTVHWELPKRHWSFIGRNYAYTSVMLDAIVADNPNNVLIPEVVRWLMQARNDGNWGTTTETSKAVRSIVNVIKNRNEAVPNEKWQVFVGDTKVMEGEFLKGDLLKQFTQDVPLASIEKNKEVPVKIQKSGSGSLYYNLNLKYYLPFEDVEPLEQGIVVARDFVDRKGKALGEEKLIAGQEYWVRLTILAPTVINNLIVEDKLPAGVEAVNESLATTGLLNAQKPDILSGNNQFYFNHSEIRDDRVVLFANYLPQGVYEYTYRVRPTTPGKYHHPPAQAYNMYIPDISGHSWGGWMEVVE